MRHLRYWQIKESAPGYTGRINASSEAQVGYIEPWIFWLSWAPVISGISVWSSFYRFECDQVVPASIHSLVHWIFSPSTHWAAWICHVLPSPQQWDGHRQQRAVLTDCLQKACMSVPGRAALLCSLARQVAFVKLYEQCVPWQRRLHCALVTLLPAVYVVSAQKEATPQHVLNAGVLCPLAAQPQYGRFAIHPAQSALA